MFKQIKLFLLQKLYRILVFKVYTVDRSVMPFYHKYFTFCDLPLRTNQGLFNFSFKEDRRSRSRDVVPMFNRRVITYLVELQVPDIYNHCDNPLHNKVIVVVMIHSRRVHYEALAKVLLDLYIDQFTQ